jgi:hypothetical protein
VHDASLISRMEGGKKALSAGYSCDIENTAGEDPLYGRFDCIQRNITYNHLAVVDVARGGVEIQARMDSADFAYQVVKDNYLEESTELSERMDKIKIGNQEFEVSAECAKAFRADCADKAAQIATLSAEKDRAVARADSAEDKAKKATERLDSVEKSALISQVKPILGSSERLDSLTPREIKVKTLTKLGVKPEKLSKASDAYVNERFDEALEAEAERNPAAETVRTAINVVQGGNNPAERADSGDPLEAAKKRNAEAMRNAWKTGN